MMETNHPAPVNSNFPNTDNAGHTEPEAEDSHPSPPSQGVINCGNHPPMVINYLTKSRSVASTKADFLNLNMSNYTISPENHPNHCNTGSIKAGSKALTTIQPPNYDSNGTLILNPSRNSFSGALNLSTNYLIHRASYKNYIANQIGNHVANQMDSPYSSLTYHNVIKSSHNSCGTNCTSNTVTNSSFKWDDAERWIHNPSPNSRSVEPYHMISNSVPNPNLNQVINGQIKKTNSINIPDPSLMLPNCVKLTKLSSPIDQVTFNSNNIKKKNHQQPVTECDSKPQSIRISKVVSGMPSIRKANHIVSEDIVANYSTAAHLEHPMPKMHDVYADRVVEKNHYQNNSNSIISANNSYNYCSNNIGNGSYERIMVQSLSSNQMTAARVPNPEMRDAATDVSPPRRAARRDMGTQITPVGGSPVRSPAEITCERPSPPVLHPLESIPLGPAADRHCHKSDSLQEPCHNAARAITQGVPAAAATGVRQPPKSPPRHNTPAPAHGDTIDVHETGSDECSAYFQPQNMAAKPHHPQSHDGHPEHPSNHHLKRNRSRNRNQAENQNQNKMNWNCAGSSDHDPTTTTSATTPSISTCSSGSSSSGSATYGANFSALLSRVLSINGNSMRSGGIASHSSSSLPSVATTTTVTSSATDLHSANTEQPIHSNINNSALPIPTKPINALKSIQQLHLINKMEREEARIDAWEQEQMAKAEAELKKLELKLDRMKNEGRKKIRSKLAAARLRADEMRAAARAHRAAKAIVSNHLSLATTSATAKTSMDPTTAQSDQHPNRKPSSIAINHDDKHHHHHHRLPSDPLLPPPPPPPPVAINPPPKSKLLVGTAYTLAESLHRVCFPILP